MGSRHLYITREEAKAFHSLPLARPVFLKECGTLVIWMSPDDEGWGNVDVNSLDQP